MTYLRDGCPRCGHHWADWKRRQGDTFLTFNCRGCGHEWKAVAVALGGP